MLLDFSQLSANQIYFTLTQVIVPRPIAWVLSDNGEEFPNSRYNLAPFSYFNAISTTPPLVMISISKKPTEEIKDTWKNIKERKNFVIHIAHSEHAEAVTESSRVLNHGESELDRLNLTTTKFDDFELPRIKECRLALACKLERIIEVGPEPQAIIFGEVIKVHIDDSVATLKEGRLTVDATKLDPLGRLGGIEYVTFGNVKKVPRPI